MSRDILKAALDGKLLKGTTEEIQDGMKKLGQSSSFIDDLGFVFEGLWTTLATNPLTWITAGIAGFSLLIKGIDTWIGKQEKLARTKLEGLDDKITTYDEEIASLEELQVKLESAKGNQSELAKIQNELNDVIGETAGLLNGEGKAYEIANAKLRANIELKKQQRKKVVKEKVSASEDLFDNNAYERDGWFEIDYTGNMMQNYAKQYQTFIDAYDSLSDKQKDFYKDANTFALARLKGMGVDVDGWSDYWNEQVQTAYDVFDDVIQDYDGVGGQDFIRNLIDNMVRGGSDLSEISNIINQVIDNEKLQNNINSYWESLVNPDMDSGSALESVKTMIKDIIDQYPQLETFFNDFYNGIVNGAEVVADTVSDTTNEIGNSLDTYKTASDDISSLATAFKELSDNDYISLETISKIKEAVGDSIANWSEYELRLLSAKKGTSEYNQLMSELTFAMLDNKFTTSELANTNEKYIERLLEENGVANANEVAHYAVERAKTIERIKTTDLSKAIEDGSIIALQNEALQCGYTEGAFWNLIAQEQIFNNTTLDVSQKISALKSLMAQAGITGSVISGLTGASSGINKINDALALGVDTNKNGDITFNGNVYGKGQDALNKAMSDASAYAFQEELKKKYNSILVDYTNLTKPVNYSDNNDLPKEIQETKETFNWIETALSRAQRAVTNFGKTVSATWRSWSTRNSELEKQITAINNELSLQQQARDTYLSKANSVGLPEPYKTLVQTGGIQIDEIANEGLKEKIKEYQEWYEKVLDCDDAMQDLNDELATLAKTKFDNVAKEFENLLSTLDHNTSMLDAYIELAETSGYMVSEKYYNALIENEKKNFDLLERERDALSATLNDAVNSGRITQGSEDWYEMTSSINDLNVALIDSQISLAKYNNSLRELDWENFDKMQEKISKITDESDYLIDLMSDEKMYDKNGNMTEQGQATLGLHTVKQSTYEAQISDYKEALAAIRKLLAEDPYNQILLDREQELIDSIQDTTLALNDEKHAIKDLYSEGYDALLNNMSKVMDKRKDMLSQAKEAYDYEKNIAEQTKDIATLEKQLTAYQGDDSEEAQATIQKLKVSLEDAKENLEETEYEKYISDQEQMLDTLYSETEAWVNERLDNIDLLIQNAIDSASANSESIKDTLQHVTGGVGSTLSDTMTEIWSSNGTIGSVLTSIEKYFADMQKAADEQAAKQQTSTPAPSAPSTSSNSSSSPAPSPSSSTTSSSWGSWFVSKKDSYDKNKLNKESSIVDRLKYNDIDSSFSARSQYYTAMGGSGKYTGSSSQNQWMLAQMKANKFDRGGIVGDLIRQTGEDGFALVRRGEGIIPTDMMPQWEHLIQSLPQLNDAILPNIPHQATNLTIDIGDIQMYGVNDPTEFSIQLKNAMLNDNAIRRIMKDTTFGEALGKNSMIRYTR